MEFNGRRDGGLPWILPYCSTWVGRVILIGLVVVSPALLTWWTMVSFFQIFLELMGEIKEMWKEVAHPPWPKYLVDEIDINPKE